LLLEREGRALVKQDPHPGAVSGSLKAARRVI
jgi:hypothetical protein